jgi:hypothetical protein
MMLPTELMQCLTHVFSERERIMVEGIYCRPDLLRSLDAGRTSGRTSVHG